MVVPWSSLGAPVIGCDFSTWEPPQTCEKVSLLSVSDAIISGLPAYLGLLGELMLFFALEILLAGLLITGHWVDIESL